MPQPSIIMSNGSPRVAGLLVLDDAVELLDLDVDADLLQVELDGLRESRTATGVERVHDRLAAARVTGGQSLRPRVVRALQGVDVEVLEARHRGRKDLIRPCAGEVAVLSDHEAAVDRMVDSLAELDVVLEQRLLSVHVDVPERRRLLTKNWLLLMPYLSESSFAWAAGKPQMSASPFSHIRRCVAWLGTTLPPDLVEIRGETDRLERLDVVLPVRVAHDQRGALGVPLLQVVRAPPTSASPRSRRWS